MIGSDSLQARLGHVADRLAWGFADLRRRLVRRGWWPAPGVSVAAIDGTRWKLESGRLRPDLAIGLPEGLLVPQADCLWGRLDLPDMRRAALDAALEEAMWRVSPLPLEQVVIASRVSPSVSGGWHVDWGLCPRRLPEEAMRDLGLASDTPVFLQRDANEALATRDRHSLAAQARRRRFGAVIAFTAVLLVAALLAAGAMPLLLKRDAVRQSMRHAEAIERQAAPVRQQLDALHVQAGLADAVRDDARTALPLASALDQLALALPDDSWLDRLEISGDQIRIAGLTGNSTDLVANLARQPRLVEVRAAAPTVRDEARGKERFSLEMRWRTEDERS